MRIGLPALLLLVACGGDRAPLAVRQEIVGGTVDTTAKHGSVFVVKIERSNGAPAQCTGTLITPRTLLTAGHCLPAETTKVWTTNVTPAPAASPSFVESTEWRRHPAWTSANPSLNDIGLILLPAASTLTPYPYNQAPLTGPFVGRPLTAVGYGRTGPSTVDSGTRRWVDLTFRGITSDHIELGDQASKGVCFGDSGGPALHTFADNVTRVVGIHSYTQPTSACTDGLDTRVDVFGTFIRTWLMEKEAGGTCVEDGLCKAGCMPAADPDCVCIADGTCSAQCANLLSDPDCPRDCAMNGVCTNLACPAPDPDCTPELAQCTMDAQCAARHCTTDPQRPAERYCARGCAAQSECVAGTTCAMAVCLKQQKPNVAPGAACVAATDFCLGGTTCQTVPMGGTRCTIACPPAACPVPTTCSAGFCLGADVKVGNPGDVCDPATTFCTGNTVCAGLLSLGPPTCAEGCVVSVDCSVKTKVCQQGVGGVRYCEHEIIVLPQLTNVSAPAGKGGCAAGGLGLFPFAALLYFVIVRVKPTPPSA